MFDYQSPITAQFYGSLSNEMIKFSEDTALAEIKEAIGYNIDKEELIKALTYDRHQYEKGYQDGKAESSVAYTTIKNACDVINDICCTAYRTKFFGDSYISDRYISEIQSALNEILEAVESQKGGCDSVKEFSVRALDEGQLDMMFNALRMGYQKPNIPALKELCDQLRQAMIQKTASVKQKAIMSAVKSALQKAADGTKAKEELTVSRQDSLSLNPVYVTNAVNYQQCKIKNYVSHAMRKALYQLKMQGNILHQAGGSKISSLANTTNHEKENDYAYT